MTIPRNYRRILVFCMLLAAAVTSSPAADTAAPAAPLTLEQCLNVARDRNETLQVQSDRQKEAAQRLTQSRGGLLPNLAFRASKFYRDNNNGSVTGEGLDTRFEAVQPLFYGFRKAESVRFAKADELRQGYLYRSYVRQVYGDVAQVFYTIAGLESDARNVRDTIKLMQDRIKELDARVRLGKSRDSEVLTVESQLAALNAQQEQLEGSRRTALENLSLLTGIDPSSLSIIDDRAPVTAAEPVENVLAAGRNRSDVLAAGQNVALEESLVRTAKGTLLPTANLDGSWYTSRSGSLSGADWDIYLLLDVPLYQGGILRSRVKEESLRLNETRQQEALLKRQVDTELRQLHHTLVASLAKAQSYRTAYEKAERSYRLQMQEYRLGLVNNLEVLQSMTALLDTKSSYDRSLLQVKFDQVMLDIATERLK